MINKIAILIIALLITITPAAFAAGVLEIDLVQENAEMGNIFFDNDSPGYFVEIKCNSSVPYQATVKYEVKDSKNFAVWTKTEDVILAPKSKTIKSLLPDISNYGIFTVTATVTSGSVAAADSEGFALAVHNKEDNGFVGVQTHFGNFPRIEQEKQTAYLTQNGGISWIRDDLRWKYTETQKAANGQPKIYKIQEIREKNINNMIAAGNNVLLVLDYINPLYDNGKFPSTDEGIDAYAEFCGYVAEYFKGRVNVFEIGNEPDLEAFSMRDVSGDEYARVLKRARDAIKAIDKNITVISAGLCSHRSEHNQEFLEQFAKEINSNGGWKNYMDYISYHPYSSDGDYSDEVSSMTFLQNYDFVQSQFGANIPVWITEWGISTQDTDGEVVFTDEQQAADIVRTVVAAKAQPLLKNISIYNFRAKHTVASPREQNFGIVTGEYDAKPAFVALSHLNSVLNGAEFVESYANRDYYGGLELLSRRNRVFDTYRFKDGETDIFVVWTRKGKTATLSVVSGANTTYTETTNSAEIQVQSGKQVEMRDMNGNLIEGSSVTLTEKPIFVVCKPTFEIKEDGGQVLIKGTTQKPYSMVTLMAKERGELRNETIAIKQTTSDNNGCFSFSFKVEDDDAYVIYIAENKGINSYNQRNCQYETDMVLTVNGIETENINNVKVGDTVKATLNLIDNSNSNEKLLFIGAIKNTDTALTHINTEKVVWSDNSAKAEIEIKIEDVTDIELLEIMLWKENLSPVSEKLLLKKISN